MERARSETARAAFKASYYGEDHDADGSLDVATPEETGQSYQPAELNIRDCPLAHALRPTLYASRGGALPELVLVDGRPRGYSGRLRAAHVDQTASPSGTSVRADTYVLRIDDDSGKINVNGGFLDTANRDRAYGDTLPDHRDPSVAATATGGHRGWNHQLTRILNLLGEIGEGEYDGVAGLSPWEDWDADGAIDPAPLGIGPPAWPKPLGQMILENRPAGGYASVEQVRETLESLRPPGAPAVPDLSAYLTVQGWVDRKVVHPNAWKQTTTLARPATESYAGPADLKAGRGACVPEEEGRPPVNLNLAPIPVLAALLEGVSANGQLLRLDNAPLDNAYLLRVPRDRAVEIAYRIATRCRAQPFATWSEFDGFLDMLLGYLSLPLVAGPIRGFPDRLGITYILGNAPGPVGQAAAADLLKANFDPNTRSNKELPDSILARWFDKTDLLDHSTEGILHPTGFFSITSLGRVTGADGKLLATREVALRLRAYTLYRETSQTDFHRGDHPGAIRLPDETPVSCFKDYDWARTSGTSATSWGTGKGVSTMTYPCGMPAVRDGNAAAWDGRIGLATMELEPGNVDLGSVTGALRFLHHFDEGWNADEGVDPVRKTAPGTSPAMDGTRCDARLQPSEGVGIWPAATDPSTLYPDGVHEQPYRSPAFAASNFPADDATSDHGVFTYWVKRPYLAWRKQNLITRGVGAAITLDFSCIQHLGGMTHCLLSGAECTDSWACRTGASMEQWVNDTPDTGGSERLYWSQLDPTAYRRHALRWDLMTVQFDSDEADATRPLTAPPHDVYTRVRGVTTGPWLQSNWYTPTFPPANRRKLMTAGSLFVLGAQIVQTTLHSSLAPFEAQVVDEFAIYDFGDDGTAVQGVIDAWSSDRFREGRYYRGGDAAFLSAEIRPTDFGAPSPGEVRILWARWTEHLPNEYRRDPSLGVYPTRYLYPARHVDPGLVYDTALPPAGAANPVSHPFHAPSNSRVRIELDLTDAAGDPILTPGSVTPFPTLRQAGPIGLLLPGFRYRVRFRTDLDTLTPLLESPWFDDITFACQDIAGPRVLGWTEH